MKVRLLVLILSLLVFFSCAAKKKTVIKELKTEKTEVKTERDSVVIITNTAAIKDTFLVSLKTNDKKIDSVVGLKFKSFYMSKRSGKNSFSASYDTIKKALQITAVLNGNTSINKTTELRTSEKKEKNTKRDEIRQDTSSIFGRFILYLTIVLFLIIGFIIYKICK